MSYSETASIVCAALAGIVLLIIVGLQVRQSILRRRGSPDSTAEEAAEVPEATEAPQPVVPAAVEVLQPVQAPQALAAEVVANPAPVPDGAVNTQPLTSEEIVSHLKELPPVQAEIEKDKYKGVKVEWTLYFSSLMLKAQGQIEVSLLNANNAYPGVSFLVDINQYPELRTIKWGTPVVVRGEIFSVYSMYIILTDVQLSFPDAANHS